MFHRNQFSKSLCFRLLVILCCACWAGGVEAAQPELEEPPQRDVSHGPRARLAPSAVTGHAFLTPDQQSLKHRLPAHARARLEQLMTEFPGAKITQPSDLHRIMQSQRRRFPLNFSELERASVAARLAESEQLARELLVMQAEELGLSLGGMENGRGYTLIGFERGVPQYVYTMNLGAAITTGANLVRWNPGFDPALPADSISGDGLYVSINDHGEIYQHTEFQLPGEIGSRIVVSELPWYPSPNRNHMTHVAGTVSAWGYSSNLQGMAPRTWIRALIQQTATHITTYAMATPGQLMASANPVTGEQEMKSVVGNTSLGTADPNTRYTETSALFDTLMRDHPYYLHFYAASNSGSGYETLGGHHPNAKNLFTIGNVSAISRNSDGKYISGGNINSTSSRGPSYDGRIKPDFVAKGTAVNSTVGETGNSTWTGTSMASPNAAGSAAALIDYVRQRFPGHFFRSSTYKALFMSTADDLGNPGPDYYYGWGAINVHAAGTIIREHAENSRQGTLIEDQLNSGQTWTQAYVSDGTSPIRVSLAWLDPAGEAISTVSTDRSARLVNDLDIRVFGPDNAESFPYVMPFVTGQGATPAFSSSLYGVHAVTGNNRTDPAEQIYIPLPVPGTYTVQISHEGPLLDNQSQPFSLSVTGMVADVAPDPSISSIQPIIADGSSDFAFAVNGSHFVLGSDIILRRAGSDPVTATFQTVTPNRVTGVLNTATMTPGYWDVSIQYPDGTETTAQNAFLVPIEGSNNTTIFESGFEVPGELVLSGEWAVGPPNQSSDGGPDAAFSGDHVLATYLNGTYQNNIDIFATLPAFHTFGRKNVVLQFQRWLGIALNQSGSPASRHADFARIHYSLDGATWTPLFATGTAINDNSWSLQSIALPAAVQEQPTVFIRFQLQTDESTVSYGWNIDELQVTADGPLLPPVLTSAPVPEAVQNEPYHYLVTATDEDSHPSQLLFDATGLPDGLVLSNNSNGTASLTGSPAIDGNFDITLSVTDGGYTTYQSFSLIIEPAPVLSFTSWIEDPDLNLPDPDRDPLANPSGDGINNLLKFAFNLDPLTPSSIQGPAVNEVSDPSGRFLTFAYRQRVGGSGTPGIDYVADGIRYSVLVSHSLDPDSWQSGHDWIEPIGTPVDNGDGTETVTIRIKQAIDPLNPAQFVRLAVEIVAP